MKLRRLRIEQFRQFRDPLEIHDLDAGINLFVGPNESGKSTVVRAIRAAFFERSRSSSVDDLQPWGDSSAAPSVQLEFEWQGKAWKLSKSFLKTKRCDLEVAGQVTSGEEAEGVLADLLGYQFSGRGASKAEHWGIPGLLWIEQGSGQDIQGPVTYAGSYLKSVLGESLGEVASSAGDELITQVERERAVLLTAGGRPTGDYAKANQLLTETKDRLQQLDTTIAHYRQQVDRLGELRKLQEQDASKPWRSYREQASQAQGRLTEVQQWELDQQREEKELQDCLKSQELCRDQLAHFAKQQDELTQRLREKQRTERALSETQARRTAIEDQLAKAQQLYQQAETALKLARQSEQRRTLERESIQLSREMAELANHLDKSRALQQQLSTRRAQLQATRIDSPSLKRLQALYRQLNELDIQGQSVATRLQFHVEPGQSVVLGDEALTGQGQRLLLEPVELSIPGVGRLRIQPGGEDTGDLARRRQAAQDSLNALLAELKVASLSEAETLVENRRTLEEDLKRDELVLSTLAPKGVEDLASRLDLCRQRQQELSSQLTALPAAGSDDTSVTAAESRLKAAGLQLKEAEQSNAQFERELSLAHQAMLSADEEWQKLHNALQDGTRQQRERELNGQLVALRASQAALEASVDERKRRIAAANPGFLRQDIERYTRTADAMEQDAQKRELELASLQSRLDALGADGLEERRAELAQEMEALARRCKEYDRRAGALNLLLELLKAKRQELTRRIQAPLQRHLNHYLQLLFPEARLHVNEDLIPELLERAENGASTHADFSSLSFGAREQMSLISRLAYADLLKEAGRPTLLILDDALVHSDEYRRTQMKRILFDAAQRHQILLFTCHPENWHDLGVAPHHMQSLKMNGAAA